MEMQELLNQMRRYGMVSTTFKQSASLFKGAARRRRPAFDDWLHQLPRGNKLPRGRYFFGKKPGRPVHILDEFWRLHY